MRKLSASVIFVILAGCATPSTGPQIEHLTKPEHLRTESILPMTFPEIQMALFKHDATCGSAPVFKMKESQTGYATVMEVDGADRPWNETIVFDLAWLQSTLRFETRTSVKVYSFYSDADVKRRIAAIYDAILKPEQCHPE